MLLVVIIKCIVVVVVLILVLVLYGVSVQDKNKIKVGILVGSVEVIFDVVKKVVVCDGLEIQIVVFSDYFQFNVVLVFGDFDVNVFQYCFYLESQIVVCGYKIVLVGLIIMVLLGIYLCKFKLVD